MIQNLYGVWEYRFFFFASAGGLCLTDKFWAVLYCRHWMRKFPLKMVTNWVEKVHQKKKKKAIVILQVKLWSLRSFFRTTRNVSGPTENWTKPEIHLSFSILRVMQPGHDIFSDPFRKPNQNLLLQDITCFLPDTVVVLKLIRVNHQSKLLHHLIPESVTFRMQASESVSLKFSCCDFQRVLLKVYCQVKRFLWCIKSNVQDC